MIKRETRDKVTRNDKGEIYQEDITFINLYASNLGVPKYIKQLLIELKEDTGKSHNYCRRPKYPIDSNG